MNDDEIKEIADQLISHSRESTAYVGIVDENQDFYIKANRDGLRLLSAELLYASINNNESKIWGIKNEWFEGSALHLNHIQLIDGDRATILDTSDQPDGMTLLGKIGCGAAGIVLAIFIIVGAFMTIKAIINWI